MKDFEHLVSVWQGQPKKDQLSVDEALKQVKKGMSGLGRKLLWNISGMAITFLFIFCIMVFFVFQSWITYLGMIIILSNILLYLTMLVREYKIINRHDLTADPSSYLQSLKEYQHSRARVYGWIYYVYVLLLSLGLSLYLFEVLHHASAQFKIAAYSLTAVWLLFCTFYLRGRIFKYEQEKLNLMIDRLVRLQDQFI